MPLQKTAKKIGGVLGVVFVALLMASCAATKVTDRHQLVTGRISKPAQIWVHAFAASPTDVPNDSVLADEPSLDKAVPANEQLALGKELGDQIANELVADIRKLGMPAELATPGTKPQLNDIVLRGYLLSVQPGSETQRVLVGFGAGGSELRTLVEGFQQTTNGLRRLGYGTLDAGGGKLPGTAVGLATFLATKNPAGLIISGGMHLYGETSGRSQIQGRAQQTAKEIADILQQRFKQQEWIN